MAVKPRIRVPAGSNRKSFMTGDSLQNFAADMGVGANNLLSQSTYGFNPVGRYHVQLEWMYRGSWVVRKVVDCPADDMTRAGIDFSSDMKPAVVDQLHAEWTKQGLWNKVRQAIKWGRLYGGAVCVIMIEGQDFSTPLRMETIGKGQFKGLLVLDRWMISAEVEDFVEEPGPDFGLPLFYDTVTDGSVPRMHIHYSRVLRFEGDDVPYWQRIAENGWTVSVVEQLYDRLIAFDSASTGAAQLVFKAHLRTYKVPNLRELIAAGGEMYGAFLKHMTNLRAMQTSEGLTIIDGEDEIEYHANGAFGGLSDAMVSFGQQLSGAAGIPLVIMFGQSPTGLNSTGESDIRNYYDRIKSAQMMHLQSPVDRIARVLYWSTFGTGPGEDFGFSFNPLWQMNETERANNASTIANAIKAVYDSGILEQHQALSELKQSSLETGIFSNITDEDILQSKLTPPAPTDGSYTDGYGKPMQPGAPGAHQIGHNGGPPLDGKGGPPDGASGPAGPPHAPAAPRPSGGPTIAETMAAKAANDPGPANVPAQPAIDPRDPPPPPGMFRLGGTPDNVKVNVQEGMRVRVNYMGDAAMPHAQIMTRDVVYQPRWTQDEFQESKVKRDDGGKFSEQAGSGKKAGAEVRNQATKKEKGNKAGNSKRQGPSPSNPHVHDVDAAKEKAAHLRPDPFKWKHKVSHDYVGNKLKKIDQILQGPDPIDKLRALHVSPTWKKVDTYKLAIIKALEDQQQAPPEPPKEDPPKAERPSLSALHHVTLDRIKKGGGTAGLGLAVQKLKDVGLVEDDGNGGHKLTPAGEAEHAAWTTEKAERDQEFVNNGHRMRAAQENALHEAASVSTGEWKQRHGVDVRQAPLDQATTKENKEPASKHTLGTTRIAAAALPQAHRELMTGRIPIEVERFNHIIGQSTTGLTGVGASAGLFSGRMQPNVYPAGEVGRIYIAENYYIGKGKNKKAAPLAYVAGTVAHEYGHAMDAALGKPSDDPDFIVAATGRPKQATVDEYKRAKYFHLNRKETWAECYNATFCQDTDPPCKYFGGMTRERAQVVYARPIAAMKKLIEQRLRIAQGVLQQAKDDQNG